MRNEINYFQINISINYQIVGLSSNSVQNIYLFFFYIEYKNQWSIICKISNEPKKKTQNFNNALHMRS